MANVRRAPARRAIEPLERRVLFVLYGPDISFGDGGHVLDVRGDELLAELPDGDLLAVGTQSIMTVDDEFHETRAMRLNPDGTVDAAFAGGAGRISLGEGWDAIYDGGSRFYLLVEPIGATNVDHVLAYTTAGVPDPAFTGDGGMDLPFTPVVGSILDSVSGQFVSATPDGGLLLLVHVTTSSPDGSSRTVVHELVRLDANGSIDETFGENGFLSFEPTESLTSAVATSNGLIVIEHPDDAGATLTRYDADGQAIDTTFGDQGTLDLEFFPRGLIEDADGKLLFVAGSDSVTEPEAARLTRLNADGSPDIAFGDGGSALLNSIARDAEVVVDPQGRIVVAAGVRIYRFSAAGVRELVAPDVPHFGSSLLGMDSAGRVLRGFEERVARFDDLEPVAVGRDGVLYVHGDETDGDDDTVTVAAGPPETIRVTRNGVIADVPTNGIVGINGITLHLGEGDNTATASLDRDITVNTGAGADTITTAGGDDTIRPGHGDNVIAVGDGNDTIEVPQAKLNEHHQVSGGDGDKTINIYSGRTTIALGTGNSNISLGALPTGAPAGASFDDHVTIAGGSNDVRMYSGTDVLEIGGSGNNKVTIHLNDHATITTGGGNDFFHLGGPATVRSNAGDDSFAMQLHDDDAGTVIFAGDGNDRVAPYSEFSRPAAATIHGGNGHDYLNGGAGGQTIYGGAGNDTIWGGNGSDLVSAGGGNDRVYAEGGNDRLYGGAGRDRIYGGNHDDRLHGGASGDWLFGQRGNNQLYGDGGNDRLYADYAASGDRPDTLIGGAGNDLLVARDSLVDQLFGGRGDDTAIADEEDEAAGVESFG